MRAKLVEGSSLVIGICYFPSFCICLVLFAASKFGFASNLAMPMFFAHLLPPPPQLGQGNIFTPVCHSVHRGGMRGCAGGMCGCSGGVGACVVAPGGVCGCSRGVCGCSGGACVVAPGGQGMHGCSRGACIVAPGGGVHGCSWGGMRGCSQGVCMAAPGGMHGCSGGACVVALGGHAWDTTTYGDTVNERAVCILLECILVGGSFSG